MSSVDIALRGWEQGSILTSKTLKDIGITDVSDDVLGVVLTHSCDIRHESFDAEPNIQIVLARLVEKCDPLFHRGRHVRQLDLDVRKGSHAAAIKIKASDIKFLPRSVFATIEPATGIKLSPISTRTLAKWVGNKFTREALPNCFNNMLKRHEKRLKRWINKAHPCVDRILFRYDPEEEIEDNGTYQVQFVLLGKGSYENIEITEQLHRLSDELSELLEMCGFSQFGKYDRVTYSFLSEMTLEESEEFISFDWGDYLSVSS